MLDRVLDGIYDDEDLRRLNEILRADAEACRRYVLYVELHGRLAWGDGQGAEGEGEIGVSAFRDSSDSTAPGGRLGWLGSSTAEPTDCRADDSIA